MTVKNTTGVAKKTQRFIRLNVDDKLDYYFKLLERDYPLMSRSELLKMLVSQALSQNQRKKSFKQILQGSNFINIENEDAQFEFLRKNGIMK
ncbi:MAG: hypothetical protein WCK98_02825 [bacterium]